MPWHVITTQPQRELAVALRAQTICEVYLPLYADRKRPMYPGYVFGLWDADCVPDRLRRITHVSGFLGLATDAEIEAVRSVESRGARPHEDSTRVGEWCRARVGSLWLEARYLGRSGPKARVMLTLLGRSHEIEVMASEIKQIA